MNQKKAESESQRKVEEHQSEAFATIALTHECAGGKRVVVDLAGAEFLLSIAESALKQTPKEKQAGRQMNIDS